MRPEFRQENSPSEAGEERQLTTCTSPAINAVAGC